MVNSPHLAHLHLAGPLEYIYSVHDSDEHRNLFSEPLADILDQIKIRRVDGLPVARLAQDTVNTFTFHFLRSVFKNK